MENSTYRSRDLETIRSLVLKIHARSLASRISSIYRWRRAARLLMLFGRLVNFLQCLSSSTSRSVRLPNPGARPCSSSHAWRFSCCKLHRFSKLRGKLVSFKFDRSRHCKTLHWVPQLLQKFQHSTQAAACVGKPHRGSVPGLLSYTTWFRACSRACSAICPTAFRDSAPAASGIGWLPCAVVGLF